MWSSVLSDDQPSLELAAIILYRLASLVDILFVLIESCYPLEVVYKEE